MRSVLWGEGVGLRLRDEPQAIFHSPGLFSSVFLPHRTFITCHDVIPLRYPVYLGRNFIRHWNFKRNLTTLKHCAGVFTDSQASKDDLIELAGMPLEKVHVMRCWLSPEFSPIAGAEKKEMVKRKYNLPDRYWLYVGGYDIRKNVPFLIDAYAEAQRRGISCPPLVLAGRIPQQKIPALCDMASALGKARSLGNQIVCPGFIEQEDLPGLYGGGELFIFPSLFEGFGLPPLEAMGCGCPSIVADNSSLKEVVTDDTYRFSTKSFTNLVELMREATLAKLPLNPSFGPEKFSLDTSFANYLQVLLGNNNNLS